MDNSKIQDTRFSNLNDKSSVQQFLGRKQPNVNRSSKISVETTMESQNEHILLPTYSFKFTGYQIGQHVEYTVILRETYKILGRKIQHQYDFKTRYSMLEALHVKINGLGFPEKKWFGNKSKEFLEKRKVELQNYLNNAAKCKKAGLLRFVKQIKDVNFNKSLKEAFSIE